MPTIQVAPPAGMQTEEGCERVNRSLETKQDCANEIIRIAAMFIRGDRSKNDLRRAIAEYDAAHESLMRAIAGREPITISLLTPLLAEKGTK